MWIACRYKKYTFKFFISWNITTHNYYYNNVPNSFWTCHFRETVEKCNFTHSFALLCCNKTNVLIFFLFLKSETLNISSLQFSPHKRPFLRLIYIRSRSILHVRRQTLISAGDVFNFPLQATVVQQESLNHSRRTRMTEWLLALLRVFPLPLNNNNSSGSRSPRPCKRSPLSAARLEVTLAAASHTGRGLVK